MFLSFIYSHKNLKIMECGGEHQWDALGSFNTIHKWAHFIHCSFYGQAKVGDGE